MFSHQLTSRQKEIRRRLLTMIYEGGLSHLGSCLSVVDILDAIYEVKQRQERFVLSNGHAGLALYAVLEKYKLLSGDISKQLHIHPDRNPAFHIDVSTGSLGQGLPIALGMALANRSKPVYCLISDGECAEGSIWEALRIIAEEKVLNLKIVLNANGWAAYTAVDINALKKRVSGFGLEILEVDGHDQVGLKESLSKPLQVSSIIFAKTEVEQFPFLKGQDAHYYAMKAEDYKQAMEQCQ